MVHELTRMAAVAAMACCTWICGMGADVPVLKPVVIGSYPHDTAAYTQGLFFWDGVFYESTGQNGSSSLRKVDLTSGRVLARTDLDRRYFGEGSAVAGGKLYMLTWTNGEVLVFDPRTLELQEKIKYPREGWGLAALPEGGKIDGIPSGAVVVASDGTANLYFLDGKMSCLRTVRVTLEGRPVRLLNELEWIDGRIWANVYTTDVIVVIDPQTGVVGSMIDCSSLIPHSERTAGMDVLNGIALAPDGTVCLTGKNWPKMFRITLR